MSLTFNAKAAGAYECPARGCKWSLTVDYEVLFDDYRECLKDIESELLAHITSHKWWVLSRKIRNAKSKAIKKAVVN